jgi:hypothetical protein
MLSGLATRPGACVGALTLATQLGCGIIGPSCNDETGAVLNANEQARAGGETIFEVVSPKDSNLVMRLTWTDPNAQLTMRATITNCGGHVGCSMDTVTPAFGPSGSSPVPQPWPKGLLEMEVDGWRGKTWRIVVTGDRAHDAGFALAVSYKISCES